MSRLKRACFITRCWRQTIQLQLLPSLFLYRPSRFSHTSMQVSEPSHPSNKGTSYMALRLWHDVAPSIQMGNQYCFHKCRTYKMSVAGWHRSCACKSPCRCLRRQTTAAPSTRPWSLQPSHPPSSYLKHPHSG